VPVTVRHDKGKPFRTEDGTDLLTRNTDTYVLVQRFYNGFYWSVSTYEEIDITFKIHPHVKSLTVLFDKIYQSSGSD
jgi:hypothetical protein